MHRTRKMVCATDVFFGIREPTFFLAELRRITEPDDVLAIDDDHQSRIATKWILNSEVWDILEETPDHLRCRPR